MPLSKEELRTASSWSHMHRCVFIVMSQTDDSMKKYKDVVDAMEFATFNTKGDAQLQWHIGEIEKHHKKLFPAKEGILHHSSEILRHLDVAIAQGFTQTNQSPAMVESLELFRKDAVTFEKKYVEIMEHWSEIKPKEVSHHVGISKSE